MGLGLKIGLRRVGKFGNGEGMNKVYAARIKGKDGYGVTKGMAMGELVDAILETLPVDLVYEISFDEHGIMAYKAIGHFSLQFKKIDGDDDGKGIQRDGSESGSGNELGDNANGQSVGVRGQAVQGKQGRVSRKGKKELSGDDSRRIKTTSPKAGLVPPPLPELTREMVEDGK